MNKNWEPVDDDELDSKKVNAFEAIAQAMADYNAGTSTAVPKGKDGRPLAVISVIELDGVYIAVHVDLEAEDVEVVWSYRP